MRAMIAIMMLAIAVPAHAADCETGSSQVLKITDWSVEEVDGIISGIDIYIDVESHADKPFRMVEGSYTFEDALGRRIAGFKFDPDLQASPGEVVETVTGYMGRDMDRVPGMNRDDVRVFACTRALVYEDGTQEVFD